MNFLLTEHQNMIKESAYDFAHKIIEPMANDIEKNDRIPKDLLKELGKVDFAGILISEEYGGMGLSTLEFAIIVQEIAKVSAVVASSYVSNICAAAILEKFGTEEQKNSILPEVVKGNKIIAVATTEPNGGSNWSITMKSKAEEHNDKLEINGRKCFISNAEIADIFIVSTRTQTGKGPMEFSGIIVEKGTEGFTLGKNEEKLGLKGLSNGELIFDNCRVPKENILGETGALLSGIMPYYGNFYCVGHSSTAAGIAKAALETTISFIKERQVTANSTLADFDGVQSKIADLAINTEMLELLSYRTIFSKINFGPDPMIQMASTKSNEMAVQITNDAMVLHGGSGCTKDYIIERLLRDARTLTFYPAVFDYYRLFAGKVLLDVPLGPKSI